MSTRRTRRLPALLRRLERDAEALANLAEEIRVENRRAMDDAILDAILEARPQPRPIYAERHPAPEPSRHVNRD